VAIWPYMPQRGAVEALEWMTDVIRCKSAEYRQCLRAAPRRELAYTYQMTPEQFGRAKELARKTGGSAIYLPVWTEHAHVGAISAHTVNLAIDGSHASYTSGGSLIVWESDTHCEVVTIGTVGTGTISLNPWVVDDYTDAYVMPAIEVTFAQEFEADRDEATARVETQARFVATETTDLSGSAPAYTTYLNYPIALTPPELIAGSVREQFEREVETLDSGSGLAWRSPLYDDPIRRSMASWYAEGQEAVWDLRVWLHSLKGRWKAFWLPSWNADVAVTKELSAGDSFIEVAAVGFAAAYTLPVDMAVMTTAGTAICLRVASVTTDGAPGTERLQFAGALSGSLALANIAQTCQLSLCRFDADRIEIQHRTGRSATVAAPTVEVPG
jgi:hypothetical protein